MDCEDVGFFGDVLIVDLCISCYVVGDGDGIGVVEVVLVSYVC